MEAEHERKQVKISSKGASMVAWRSGDGGGVSPPAVRTTLLSPFLSQDRFPSLSAHRFLQPSFHAKIGNLKVFLSYKVGPKTATSSFSSS